MGKFLAGLLALFVVWVFLRAAFPALAQDNTTTNTQVQAAQGVAQAQSPCGTSVTVVYGDTMGAIAARCQVNYAALVAANPLITNPNLIFPGQVVNIPTTPTNPPIPTTGAYTIRAGDTLSIIAQRYNTTVQAIQAANPFITNINLIYPGQVISIPSANPGPIPPTGGVRYTVRTGDTLFRIARSYNTTVPALQALNPFITNANLIYPGQVITIR